MSERKLFMPASWLSALAGIAVAAAVSAAIPQKMQAVRTDSAGAPGAMKIETVDVPTPKEGQVLVQVYAAGTNPSDWRTGGRPGGAAGAPGGAPPGGASGPPGAAGPNAGGAGGPPGGGGRGMMARNPGNDMAGVIVAVGPGVTEYKVGDAVISGLQQAGGGSYAEYAVANVADMALKPKKFTFEQAAGIPTAGFTGLRMVILSNIKKGERVVVIGAAGGVGSTAVQAAKVRGAYVIASASSKHNAYLKSIGVDEIVNYDKEKPEDKIKDADLVISTVDTENAPSLKYVKKGGRVMTIAGQVDQAACTAAGVTCMSGGPNQGPSNGDLLKELSKMADEGKYTVKVDKVFPLTDVNAAHELGRAGNREGKIVLSINKDSAKR